MDLFSLVPLPTRPPHQKGPHLPLDFSVLAEALVLDKVMGGSRHRGSSGLVPSHLPFLCLFTNFSIYSMNINSAPTENSLPVCRSLSISGPMALTLMWKVIEISKTMTSHFSSTFIYIMDLLTGKKKKHNLKFKNYVLFGELSED